MIRLPNYEVAISALPNPSAPPTPILALSFAWDDTDRPRPGSDWRASTSSCALTAEGFAVNLDGTAILFPLDDGSAKSDLPGHPLGLPRQQFVSLLESYQSVYVCAFDVEGDMIASIGFLRAAASQH